MDVELNPELPNVNRYEQYFVDFTLPVADQDFCFPDRNTTIALVPVRS